jgi:serine/threonine-protein kinase
MLYECATGTRPFVGESQYELMHAIVTARVAPPSSLQATLPPAFDEIVMTAMHRDPAKRYESLEDLGAALLSLGDAASWARWKHVFLSGGQEQSPWAASSQTLSDSDAVPVPKARVSRSRKPTLAGWGFLLMTCVAVGTTLALVASRRAPDPVPAPADTIVPGPAPQPTVHADVPPASPPALAPAVEPVSPFPARAIASSPRRPATAAPHPRSPSDPIVSAPTPPPSASARVKVAPQRGTNGVPIFE